MFSLKSAMMSMQESLERTGKLKALEVLRSMDRNWLEERGYSLEALDQGLSAWPWLKPEPTQVKLAEVNCEPAVRNSESITDDEHKDAA